MSAPIHYINTDLELISAADLTTLASVLASKNLVPIHLSVPRFASLCIPQTPSRD